MTILDELLSLGHSSVKFTGVRKSLLRSDTSSKPVSIRSFTLEVSSEFVPVLPPCEHLDKYTADMTYEDKNNYGKSVFEGSSYYCFNDDGHLVT